MAADDPHTKRSDELLQRAVPRSVRDPTASERLYALLVTSVRDYAIFALDATGHIVSWNAGAQRIKGYSANEIIGRHFSTFYTPEDVASGKTTYELEVAARDGRIEDEGWRVRKDGTRFWANVIITALRDEDGKLVGFAKVTRDLSERRAAEQRALEDTRRLAEVEAANRAKSEFLRAMSHELRTPLNAIGGYADLLALGIGGQLNEAQSGYIERIRRSQQHLLAIITDLLNLGRIEAGELGYDVRPTSLASVIDAVFPMIDPKAAGKSIELRRGERSEDVRASADRARLEQILVNLLSNAVKFTDEGGRIVVSCGTINDRATITVEDTGIGIPAEKLEEIFEPFVQLGRSLTTGHEGLGVGLAISRDLARGMGGDLTVRSTVGAGSVFTVELPRAD
jgi:PAS domain S-box-containing protein